MTMRNKKWLIHSSFTLVEVVIAIVVLAVVAGLILWKTGMLSTPEERMKSVWDEIQEIERSYSGEGPYAVYVKIAKLNLRRTPPEFAQEVSIYANALCEMANLEYKAGREGWLEAVANALWGETERRNNEYARCISTAQEARKNIYIMAESGNSYNNALNLWKEERYEEAIAEGKKAAELGSPHAVYFLAWAYMFGPETIQSPTNAYQYSKQLADAEYPDGNYLLGICYHRGIGCEKDDSASLTHLRKAVENRHAEAEYLLGLMYLAGCGVERNDNSRQEGMRLLSLAAQDGCEEAEAFLKNPVDANNPLLHSSISEK